MGEADLTGSLELQFPVFLVSSSRIPSNLPLFAHMTGGRTTQTASVTAILMAFTCKVSGSFCVAAVAEEVGVRSIFTVLGSGVLLCGLGDRADGTGIQEVLI